MMIEVRCIDAVWKIVDLLSFIPKYWCFELVAGPTHQPRNLTRKRCLRAWVTSNFLNFRQFLYLPLKTAQQLGEMLYFTHSSFPEIQRVTLFAFLIIWVLKWSYSSEQTNYTCCFVYYFKDVWCIDANVFFLRLGGDGWMVLLKHSEDEWMAFLRCGENGWVVRLCHSIKERAEDGWLTFSVFVDLRTDRTNITWIASKKLAPIAFEHTSKWWLL